MDLTGRIVGWNRQAERIFGWTRKEVLGLFVIDLLVPDEFREAFVHETTMYVDTGENNVLDKRLEATALRKNGEEFPVEFSTSAIGTDRSRHFTVFVRDITERVEAEERLRVAKEAAEEAALAKSEFLATMSHEIRTPLNGIFGMTELALDTDHEGERRDFLARARACAQSLMTILNDVLDFSKIEAGHLPIERIAFEPEALLDGVIDTLAAEAQRKGIELIGCLDPSVPPGLIGDPGRVRQVLVNLGGNALKFTERGEVVIRLFAQPESDSDRIILHGEVHDTGIGISEDQHGRIFEAFTQADSSTTREYGGTGLGLAIVQRLVDVMDGVIRVQSTPGVGSEFTFSLPIAVDAGVNVGAPHLHQGLRVLVVDDNEASRRHLIHRFRDWDCHADGAPDGATASALVASAAREGSPYRLVLVDLDMPDPDGATTARWVRGTDSGSDACLIALTPLAASESSETRALGFDGAIAKPIKQKHLRAALTSALSRGVHREGPRIRAVPARNKTA